MMFSPALILAGPIHRLYKKDSKRFRWLQAEPFSFPAWASLNTIGGSTGARDAILRYGWRKKDP